MRSTIGKFVYFLISKHPFYKKLENIQHRLVMLEASSRRLEWATIGRDNPLESGERVVATTLDDVIPSHRVRYEMALEKASQSKRVLDIACGIGYGCAMLADADLQSQIIVVDISKENIAFSEAHYDRPNVSYICGEADSINEDDKFDLIACFETIEHVSDDSGLLDRLSKALNLGGTLFLSTTNEDIVSVHQGNHFHYRHYRYDNLISMLGNGGFDVVRTHNQLSDDDYALRDGHEGMYIVLEAVRRP